MDPLTKKGTVSGKAIFEGRLKFADSGAGKKFDITASTVQIEEYRSAHPSTEEHKKL